MRFRALRPARQQVERHAHPRDVGLGEEQGPQGPECVLLVPNEPGTTTATRLERALARSSMLSPQAEEHSHITCGIGPTAAPPACRMRPCCAGSTTHLHAKSLIGTVTPTGVAWDTRPGSYDLFLTQQQPGAPPTLGAGGLCWVTRGCQWDCHTASGHRAPGAPPATRRPMVLLCCLRFLWSSPGWTVVGRTASCGAAGVTSEPGGTRTRWSAIPLAPLRHR